MLFHALIDHKNGTEKTELSVCETEYNLQKHFLRMFFLELYSEGTTKNKVWNRLIRSVKKGLDFRIYFVLKHKIHKFALLL